jgi:serine/threonine protein kinase/tetratricopeptide (TPR) repeat protein
MNEPNSEETILVEALRLPPAERSAYLDQSTGGNISLRLRVESLLRSYQAGDFLEQAVAPVLGQTIASPIPLTEKAGDRIGRYKLLQKIGEGGCGVVYMADQEEPVRRRVALKIIKVGLDTKSVIARFEAEGQALALMDHPNIAKVFDAGATETGRPFFVMELVCGMKITDYCDEAKLSFRARLDLFMQVCHAIQHAHQKGIIHRDIKPSNILVTINDGVAVPKVIDFGIAKATGGLQLTDKTVFTAFGQFIGTPAYMSPEQAVMTSLDIDTRSDIYALGVLLYELLTGKTPFETKELLAIGLDEMRRTIREKDPERPSTRLSTLPDKELSTTARSRGLDAPKLISQLRGDLDWIVMKALEKDRARRYETANGLAMDLQRHLNNEPIAARPPSTAYVLTKLARRHTLAFAAAGIVAFTLLGGILVSSWYAVRATRAEKVAEKERQQAITERAKAQEAEAEAKAVNDFLQKDVLSQAQASTQAQSGITVDPNITVRQALDHAAERLESRFTNQPLVEASIRMTLAASYDELGEQAAARRNSERAFELRERILGAEHPLTLDSMIGLAGILTSAGSPNEAVAFCEKTFALLKRLRGRAHPDTFKCMDNLGMAYGAVGRWSEAVVLLEESVQLHKAKQGPQDGQTLMSRDNLAIAYQRAGRLKEALPLCEETFNLWKTNFGPDHPGTLASMGELAAIYGDAGRLSEALRLNEETLKLFRAKLGPEHPNTLTSMNNLARAYQAADRLNEALPLFEEALKLRKSKLGPDDLSTLISMNNLARAYQEAGRTNEAVPLFEETLKLQKSKLGPGHPSTLLTMNNLAMAYLQAGRTNEALPLMEETLKLQKSKLGPDHPDTLNSMKNLSIVYWKMGRLNEELSLLEEKWKLQKSKLGPEHPDTLGTLENLAWADFYAGRVTETIRVYSEVLTPAFTSQPKSVGLLLHRAELLARFGRWKEAEADLSHALELQPDKVWIWHCLAAVLVQERQPEACREHCRKSLERFGNTTDPVTAERIAKDCLILPGSGADLDLLARLAHTASSSTNDPSGVAWGQLTQSLADYRQGHFTSALDWSEKALTKVGGISGAGCRSLHGAGDGLPAFEPAR